MTNVELMTNDEARMISNVRSTVLLEPFLRTENHRVKLSRFWTELPVCRLNLVVGLIRLEFPAEITSHFPVILVRRSFVIRISSFFSHSSLGICHCDSEETQKSDEPFFRYVNTKVGHDSSLTFCEENRISRFLILAGKMPAPLFQRAA